MQNKKILSNIAMALSVIAVVMAAIVNITQTTIWIAGTQWILIGIALAVYAIYLNCCCACGVDKKEEK